MRLRIRDIREDRDITQKEIADLLACDQSLYSKYERGEREIPLRYLVKLAQFYNVSLDYLAGLADEKSNSKDGWPVAVQAVKVSWVVIPNERSEMKNL